MTDLAERAEAFRRLHLGNRPFVLPNAFDVPSARVFEDAGFPAIATSSAGLMVSHGFPDGQAMPRRELMQAVGRIAHAVALPLSADVVAGYGRGPKAVAATVRAAVEAGAVGINLEDLDPGTEHLYRLPAQVKKIRAVRELAGTLGVPVVINARTDALRHGAGDDAARLKEAIRRATAFRDAGADCVYPMGLTDAISIATFVAAVNCPVNVMVRKGLPPLPELERLGVRRVSFGPGASYATLGLLKRIGEDVLQRGSFDSLLDGAISFDELNRLAVPRAPASPPPAAPPAAPPAEVPPVTAPDER
jgi:2-methylisocitrate lyase-like PEP mutase family enzyme